VVLQLCSCNDRTWNQLTVERHVSSQGLLEAAKTGHGLRTVECAGHLACSTKQQHHGCLSTLEFSRLCQHYKPSLICCRIKTIVILQPPPHCAASSMIQVHATAAHLSCVRHTALLCASMCTILSSGINYSLLKKNQVMITKDTSWAGYHTDTTVHLFGCDSQPCQAICHALPNAVLGCTQLRAKHAYPVRTY
jgi:hypothetical protein